MSEHQQDAEWNVAEGHGKMLIDRDGEKIGRLQDVYVDVENDEPQFAELNLPSFTLAIGHTDTVRAFGDAGVARPAAHHTVIIEFKVPDVDAEFDRLTPLVDSWVQTPTTMPWGNRSILFRDPDGNLVNFFTPVTEAAMAKFAR